MWVAGFVRGEGGILTTTMSSLVIVSNRLPIKAARVNGKIEITHSDGGLPNRHVFSRNSRSNLGWLARNRQDDLTKAEKTQITKELKKIRCIPVFLSKVEVAAYYEGYSNDTLWPLMHYFPSLAQHNEHYWKSYVAAKKFARIA